MPTKPCDVKFALIEQLSKRAMVMASVANVLSDLVAANGNVPPPQRLQEMQALRLELQKYMEDWEWANEKLEKHRVSHGC